MRFGTVNRGSRHKGPAAQWLGLLLLTVLAALLAALLVSALGCSGQDEAAAPLSTVPAPADPLTLAERQWLEQKHTLLVGAFSDYPPFGFVDENGLAVGVTVDYWRLLAERLGVSVVFVPGLFSEQVEGLKAGTLDSIAGMFPLPERAKSFDFSDPYCTVETHIYVDTAHADRTTVESLKGLAVAVVAGDIGQELADRAGLSTLVVKGYPQAIMAVGSGKAQAMIIDRPVAEFYLPRYGLAGAIQEVGAALGTGNVTMPVRKGDVMLLGILNKGCALISAAEVRAIFEKWTRE
jgi:ABC-type amino acid transport substrate-binding protein